MAAEEIADSYPALLEELRDKLAEHSAAPRERIMPNLRERAAMLEGKVLDPRLRSFTNALATDFGEDLDGWTELVAMNVTQATPTTWTDDDQRSVPREPGRARRNVPATRSHQLRPPRRNRRVC